MITDYPQSHSPNNYVSQEGNEMITLSNPKLSDRLRPDIDAAPWVIAKIEKLEQQLAEQDTQLNHAKQMHEMLEQELAEREKQAVLLRKGFTDILTDTCEKFPGQRMLQIMGICDEALTATEPK